MAKPSGLPAEYRKSGRRPGLIARLLVVLFCIATFAVFSGGKARAETRSLKIYNVHTGEKLDITFKRNGHYVPAGLRKLDYIMRDWRKNKQMRMDPRLYDLLWSVYRKSGASDYIHVICGYRTADTNAMLRGRSRSSGVAKTSQHLFGKAADFYIPQVRLEKLREIGMKFQVGGVGYYPHSGSPFVHMDTGSVRAWPRMSRQQLVRLFPNGNTLHLPADGKPLPGYQTALASYKQRVTSDSIVVAGGGVSSARHSGGNLLAALFGRSDDEDEPDDSSVSPRQSGAAPVRSAQQAEPVELPATAPLPGVRGSEIASAAETSNDAGAASSAPGFADLMALASVPLPQDAPRSVGPSDPMPDGAVALVADAGRDDIGPGDAANAVPMARPELVAYAPMEDSVAFPSPKTPPTPSLRPTAIIAAARATLHTSSTVTASRALAARMRLKTRSAPAGNRFAMLSGEAVRGGRPGVDPGITGGTGRNAGLTGAMIARWARERSEYAARIRGAQAASMRMRRVAPAPRTAPDGMARIDHKPIDPQRFAAAYELFPNID